MSGTSPKDADVKHATHVIELSELKQHGAPGAPIFAGGLSAIHSVKVRLRVSVGQATMSIGELLSLKEGGVLKLDTPLDLPVEILLEDKVVARGQLVAVDDNFGVRITEPPRSIKP
jgi:flagellar motor switch protein FliN/FliY